MEQKILNFFIVNNFNIYWIFSRRKVFCWVLSYFFFFFFTLFYFTILCWFCHTSTWIHHGCTRVPNPEPPSYLPPYTILLGHPSAPAPSILYPASNLNWQFVSYMILYMFQCHSLKSSHPLGFRIWNTCTLMVDSCWCMAKPIH